MALKLNERYPGRFDNPSAEYPQGSFKNRTTPDAKDGSYLEKDWANDKEGFFQSLLSQAGITANGAVDAVGASQYFSALTAIIESLSPPGQVAAFARSTAPTGWLKANGAAVSRTTYAALFAAIGTTFGVGDGSTTFNLPDMRGEFLRGLDDGRGVDAGRALGSWQADDFKAHKHVTSSSFGLATTATGNSAMRDPSSPVNTPPGSSEQSTGSAGGAETRPRNVALLYCIKI
ncbi:tail fiber protein [Pseudomonas putida]|nr:tail fiber protein [Pseudomonas putida]EKT8868607.1 tail fiber protein [Pseudomonas putida]